MQKALENDPIPIGLFYQAESVTFEEHFKEDEKEALVSLSHNLGKLQGRFEL